MNIKLTLVGALLTVAGFNSAASTIECSVSAKSATGAYDQVIKRVAFTPDSAQMVLLNDPSADGINTAASFNPAGPSLQVSVSSAEEKRIYTLVAIINFGPDSSLVTLDPVHDRMIFCSYNK